jgi:hypothetical protein
MSLSDGARRATPGSRSDAGHRHLCRCRGADPRVALPHLRLGALPTAGCRRGCRGSGGVLRRRERRPRCLSLWSGRSVVRLAWAGIGFRWPLFRDILRVGAVAALVTVQTNLTIAIATGLVGRFGPAAIAGYGTGSRVEYLLIPLVFGLGGPLVAMVGTNIGAGQRDRAVRAAWIGAAIAAGLTEMVGLGAAAPAGLELKELFDQSLFVRAAVRGGGVLPKLFRL